MLILTILKVLLLNIQYNHFFPNRQFNFLQTQKGLKRVSRLYIE